MLMKLFAWNDRRETRDAWNLASLLQNYNKVVDEEQIFADEELYRAVGYDAVKAGAALLGKDAAAIADTAGVDTARDIVYGGLERGDLSVQVGTGLKLVEEGNRISTAEELLRVFLIGFKK